MACMVCSMMTIVTPCVRMRGDHPQHVLDLGRRRARRAISSRSSRLRPRGERARELHQAQLDGREVAGEHRRSRRAGRRARSRPRASSYACASFGWCANAPTTTLRDAPTARANGRTIWNVRPDPGAADLVRRLADQLLALEAHAARGRARGSRSVMLNSVVLPAPFGPMMPRISPVLHVEARRSASACRPPKRTATSRDLEDAVAASTAAGGRFATHVRLRRRARARRASARLASPACAASHGRMPSGASEHHGDDRDAVAPRPGCPGRMWPSSTCSDLAERDQHQGAETGPATVPMPPNRVTISGARRDEHAEHGLGGVTMSRTTRVERRRRPQ